MKEAMEGTINSRGIPLIDIDCCSSNTKFLDLRKRTKKNRGTGRCTLEGGLYQAIQEVCTSQVPQPRGKERKMQWGNEDEKEAASFNSLKDPMGNAQWPLPFI